MPSFNTMFKAEVARLARKEVKAAIEKVRKASTHHRLDIADLKRRVQELDRKIAFLERQETKRIGEAPAAVETKRKIRFSPRAVKSHRAKLGVSAADYGRLVGVAGLTIYNWEGGKSKPRAKQLQGWAAIRGLGKREALRRLELLGA
ncbi:MAG: hypothetical protein ACC662_01215 [Planctomycetota bacterium]